MLRAVGNTYSPGQLALFAAVVSGAAIATRMVWMFPGGYLPFIIFRRALRDDARPPRAHLIVAGWAGMRGTITLAAALSIPAALANGAPFPGRDIVIFLAACVILVTLLLQGTTLEALIRRLGVRADDTLQREERHARITAVEAGLRSLRDVNSPAARAEGEAARQQVMAEYDQRLTELTAEGETQATAHRHREDVRLLRLQAIRAERTALDDLWRRDVISDEAHRPLQQLLDYEEAMLATVSEPAGPE